jgi:hypothetical protein
MVEKLVEVASPRNGLKSVTPEDIEMGKRLRPLLEEFGLKLYKSKNGVGNLGVTCELALARALRMDFEKRFAAGDQVATGYAKWHPEKGFDKHHYEGPCVFADLDDALIADVLDSNETDGTDNRTGWRATPVKVTVFK